MIAQPTVTYHPGAPGDPYAAAIERLVGREFPQLSSGRTEDVLEAVMGAVLATKQYRYGPKPNPESEVAMRDVVRRAIEAERAIPLLIPAASVKVPLGESADVAELSALRVLAALQARVQEHYPPGLSVRVRLEDLTELVISTNVLNVRHYLETYQETLGALVRVLGYGGWLALVPESSLTDEGTFLRRVEELAAAFDQYLRHRSPVTEGALQAAGWTGGVSTAFEDYVRDRYVQLYPGCTREAQTEKLARYLAAILARRQLNAVGADPTFRGRLELSFAPALPDAPRVSTRVQYRTVPLSQSSFHAPFWNAKGFLKINEAGVPRISLGAWGGPCVPGQLELTGNGATALVRADYELE